MKTRAIILSKKTGVIIVSFFIIIFFTRLSVAEDVAEVQSDYDVPVSTTMLSTGAAQFSYPIQLPPARNGLIPDLSLHYNSYSKNGWIGMGWSLDLGAVYRSGKRGMDYSANDYVFTKHASTQELVSRSDWGTDYFGAKVERNFVKYYKNSSSGGWEAWQKDGTKYYYGSEDASRQTNGNGIFKWCLDRVEDSNGNQMTITYTKDNGQIYMNQINYPGNNLVTFDLHFDGRADQCAKYDTKSAVVTVGKLREIEIFGNGQLASRYALAYETDSHTNRTRLTSITRYGSDDITTLPAMQFSYKNGGDATFNIDSFSSGTGSENVHHVAGDFNGDGITDMAFIPWPNNIIYLMQANGTGGYDISALSYGPNNTGGDSRWGVGDFDGDGRSDLLEIKTSTYAPLDGFMEYGHQIYIRTLNDNGAVTSTPVAGQSPNKVPGLWMVADYNGDGKSDFAQTYVVDAETIDPTHYFDTNYAWYGIRLWLSNGNGTFQRTETLGYNEPYNNEPYVVPQIYHNNGANSTYPSSGQWRSVDFNGDGRMDLINMNTDPAYDKLIVWIAQPDGTFAQRINCWDCDHVQFRETTAAKFFEHGLWETGDLNGDGLGDIIHTVPSVGGVPAHIDTYISKGDGTFVSNQFGFQVTISGWWRIFDINGDGLEDLLYVQLGSTYIALISNGNGTFDVQSHTNSSLNYDGYQKLVGGDFNGDGLEDLALMGGISPGTATTLISNANGQPGLLEKIEIEKGAVFDLEYLPSSAYENELLPFVVHTLSKMTINDAVADTDVASVTEYGYHGGLYDFEDREFRGFEWAKQINPDGSAIKTWFHRDRFRKKLENTIRLYENSEEEATWLYETSLDWESVPEESDWGFVKLNSRQTTYYDSATVFTREDYIYDDDNGNLIQTTLSGTDAENIIKSFEYGIIRDWNWRTTLEKVKSPSEPYASREVLFRYDSNGNLLEKEEVNHNGGNPIWGYVYDTYGNVIQERDANGSPATLYEYDNDTNTYPVSITNPAGHVTLKAWDYRWGKEIWMDDPNGNRTQYDYDFFGRLTQTDFPDGGQTQKIFYDYCYDGDCSSSIFPYHVVTKVLEAGGSTVDTHLYYDGLGRKVQTVTTGEGASFIASKTHYDEMGRTYYESGPFERSSAGLLDWNWNDYTISHPYIHTFFDKRGRPTSTESMDGENGILPTIYQYNGFATTITDPDTASKTEVKDHLERIIHMIEHVDSGDIHTRYTYNSSDDLLRVKNHFWTDSAPDQNCIITEYNSLGRKTYMKDPDMGQWQYQYDPNGNLTQQTDAKGQAISFAYDMLNRPTSKTYSTSDPAVTYTYDNSASGANGIGRPYTISNTVATTTYNAYDEMGRELSVTKSIQGAPESQYTFNTAYDPSGKVASTTYPDNYQVNYTYHPGSNFLNTVADSTGIDLATLTDYAPTGKIGHILYGNDVTTDYAYDGWSNRLTSIITNGPGGNPVLQNRFYGYTPAGDIELITDSVKSVSYYYAYDKLHRLISETSSDGSIGLTPSILQLNYDNPDHIHAVSSASHIENSYDYTYDANGNMETGPDFTNPGAISDRTLSFNADNMPQQVAHTSSGTTNFLCDGDGKRAKKEGPSGTTYYLSNDFEVINGVPTCYIFAGNLRIAKVTDANITYYHKDHLGSSTVMTDSSGIALETGGYLPFGMGRENPGITLSNYTFTDQELDTESGLYNYDARLYDPVLGRFISADSLIADLYNPQNLNRYSYVLNNPLIYNDPSGFRVEVGVHSILSFGKFGTSISHSCIIITLDTPKLLDEFGDHPDFVNTNAKGEKFVTLGAEPEGGKLKSDVNRRTDVNNYKKEIVAVDLQGKKEKEVINAMFENDKNYNDDLGYGYVPGAQDGYNSNSYTSGMIKAVDLKPPGLQSTTPGYGKPAPKDAFSPTEEEE